MVSRSHHWLHQFQLVTKHSLKGATNYGNRATGVGTKHAVLRPSRDLDKMNSSALESRDHGLEITRVTRLQYRREISEPSKDEPNQNPSQEVKNNVQDLEQNRTGCLLCRLHPAASNLTMRQSRLQSVYVLGWTCVSRTFADVARRSTLAVCTALSANMPS